MSYQREELSRYPGKHDTQLMVCTTPDYPFKELILSNTVASQFKPSKILVPVDFSSSSDAALDTAVDLALVYKAEIYMLHVVPMLTAIPGTEYPTDFFPAGDFLKDAREQAELRLTRSAAALEAKGVRAYSGVEVENDVVESIMSVIQRENVDFVVLSTHGVSGWRAMVFGSIAEKLVKLVQCPMLLLRSVKTDAGAQPLKAA